MGVLRNTNSSTVDVGFWSTVTASYHLPVDDHGHLLVDGASGNSDKREYAIFGEEDVAVDDRSISSFV